MKAVKSYKHFLKAVTWRIIASLTTASLVYLATGNFTIALLVAFPETVLKICFYVLHEKAWEILVKDRNEIPLSSD